MHLNVAQLLLNVVEHLLNVVKLRLQHLSSQFTTRHVRNTVYEAVVDKFHAKKSVEVDVKVLRTQDDGCDHHVDHQIKWNLRRDT
jgi:hypothetical protein